MMMVIPKFFPIWVPVPQAVASMVSFLSRANPGTASKLINVANVRIFATHLLVCMYFSFCVFCKQLREENVELYCLIAGITMLRGAKSLVQRWYASPVEALNWQKTYECRQNLLGCGRR